MTGKLKVAIVGCGIGEEHLRYGFGPTSELFDVVALCDLDTERLAAVAARHGIGSTTTRFDDLLTRSDIDVIDICTPPTLHYPQARAALEAGKHVICEKPLVGSLAEMDALEVLLARSPGQLMPIFQYRFGDGVQKALRIVSSGIPGKPYFAAAETFWRRDPDYYANPWRGRWASEMGGVLMTQAIHIHDMVTLLMGPVSKLFGRIGTRVNPIEVEDCASASLEFANGALGTFAATLGSQDQISRVRLMFENVTIESAHDAYAPGQDPWTFIPRNAEIEAAIAAELADFTPVAPGFASQFRGFHAAILDGAPMPVTMADSRHAIEIASAFYHSAHDRVDVDLPIAQGHPVYDGWVSSWTQRRAVG